ncbi:MAG TPA: hypothetical protein PLT03_00915 [Bacillota bacterium]|nr:hypothetical protein [Bacillota bacterium]HOG52414.1 hypothetical protein [Bacillota bacterium]
MAENGLIGGLTVDMDRFAPARVTVLCGAFGSGKTEIAVNIALGLGEKHNDVTLVDIDIVKPMFRSRELRSIVVSAGVRMVDTIAGLENADLPIVTGEVDALLGKQGGRVVIDVGGDHLGARALGRYAGKMASDAEVLYVVNTRRPFSSNKDEIVKMMGMVSGASRLAVSGLVANTNLATESDFGMVYEGMEVLSDVSRETGLPVKFIVVYDELARQHPDKVVRLKGDFGLEVLPLRRYLLKPWEK